MRSSAASSILRIGILPLLVLIVLSCVATAQKCTWNVSGDRTLEQDNGITVKLSLRQTDKKVTGSASFQGMKQGHSHIEIGRVSGVFQEEGKYSYVFRVEIKWEYGETGVYKGYLQNEATNGKYVASRIIKGEAYIREDAHNQARKSRWKIVEEIPCVRAK